MLLVESLLSCWVKVLRVYPYLSASSLILVPEKNCERKRERNFGKLRTSEKKEAYFNSVKRGILLGVMTRKYVENRTVVALCEERGRKWRDERKLRISKGFWTAGLA